MAPSIAVDSAMSELPIAPPVYDTITITDHEYDVAAVTLKRLKSNAKFVANLKTSHQGAVEPFTIIEGPVAWKAADLRQCPEEWIHHFSQQELEELDAAVKQVEASGIDAVEKVPTVAKDDFPLPTLGDQLRRFAAETSQGRGFQLLRGIPVQRYTRLQLVIMWWGIGQHIGRIMPINKFGHLINHLHDLGSDIKGQRTRSPNTNLKQNFHSDQFCIGFVGMLSIGKALQGGDSRWVSGVTIHNELLRRGRKDLVEALTQRNFWMGVTGYLADAGQRLVEPDGTKNYVPVQPFNYTEGRLDIVYQGTGYISAQEKDFIPRLSPLQLEAMRTVQALAQDEELSMRMILQPGDVQFVDNTTMLHTRDAFVDGEAPNEKRHLLRWWVDPSGKSVEELRSKPSPPGFGERLIDPSGGWPQPPGTTPKIVLDTVDKSNAFFF